MNEMNVLVVGILILTLCETNGNNNRTHINKNLFRVRSIFFSSFHVVYEESHMIILAFMWIFGK